MVVLPFFCFKQKTAYEMRISDWSSDVCSSDLTSASPLLAVEAMRAGATDYLVKPVAPDRLMHALHSATMRETPRDELQPLAEKIPATLDFEIGRASCRERVCQYV